MIEIKPTSTDTKITNTLKKYVMNDGTKLRIDKRPFFVRCQYTVLWKPVGKGKFEVCDGFPTLKKAIMDVRSYALACGEPLDSKEPYGNM